MRQQGRPKTAPVMITDLDEESDQQHQQTPMPAATTAVAASTKPTSKKKQLLTVSGGFNGRSRSVDCHLDLASPEERIAHERSTTRAGKVHSGYFNELLQAKEKQLEKLLQRLATVHKFNEQFAEENDKLHTKLQTLEQRNERLQRQVDDCDKCRSLTEQLSAARTCMKDCETDVEMMKTLVYRLNVQIESYQDRERNSEPAEKKSEAGRKSECMPWTGPLLTHTLSPLLKSYDEMIADKDDLIKQYTTEFEYFTGELKRIVEENNRLLQENDTLRQETASWSGDRTRLQAQLDVCRTKAEAHARQSDLAKEKLIEVMHCYEQKMQAATLDMEHLQSAYARCKNDLATLKAATSQPHHQQQQQQQQQKSIEQALLECKELLEQLRQQHSKEKHSLERTIGELSERNAHHESELSRLRQENGRLKREIEEHGMQTDECEKRLATLQRQMEKVKTSRDRLKSRLRIALQWAQKLEEGQANIQGTWDALKRLESIVKHKESQVRGLQSRHLQEIDKLQKKLVQKEETIRKILKGKLQIGVEEGVGGGEDP